MKGFGAKVSIMAAAVRAAVRDITDEEMNRLQEHGVISDNCVFWQDVFDCDREKAREWLEDHKC